MTLAELDEAVGRLRRLTSKIEEKAGRGYVNVYQDTDGGLFTHHVSGVKSTTEIEDELLSATVWAWSIKDYLKELSEANGERKQLVEELVNRTLELQLVADIANGAKHGKLRESRSGKFPKLQPVKVVIPQSSLGTIKFEGRHVSTTVIDTTSVQYEARILSESGDYLGDLFEVLRLAVEVWETEGFSITGFS